MNEHTQLLEDSTLRGIALNIARNEVGAQKPIENILLAMGIKEERYKELCKDETFVRYVQSYTSELSSNGFSFTTKARILAEDLLATAYQLAVDPDCAAGVRVKMIENLVEWAGLKPKTTVGDVSSGSSFSITINVGTPAQTPDSSEKTIDSSVIDAEKEEKPFKMPQLSSRSDTIDVDVQPVVDRERIKTSLTDLFDEPDGYEYAGDDYL